MFLFLSNLSCRNYWIGGRGYFCFSLLGYEFLFEIITATTEEETSLPEEEESNFERSFNLDLFLMFFISATTEEETSTTEEESICPCDHKEKSSNKKFCVFISIYWNFRHSQWVYFFREFQIFLDWLINLELRKICLLK